MSLDIDALDSHIERLRKGETLTENEVRALCEKVRTVEPRPWRGSPIAVVGRYNMPNKREKTVPICVYDRLHHPTALPNTPLPHPCFL